jgi:RNA polymerase sigma-70 factor (ECF subfamily)
VGLDVRWPGSLLQELTHAGLTMSSRDSLDAEFEAFFLENFYSISDSVRMVCGNPERADDATQEAFIKAYARWRTVRRYDNPGAWIRRIAINASRDAHRAESRRNRREERAAAPAPDYARTVDQDDSLLGLLEQLPDRQRAVAALFYLDEMSTIEIGRLLDIAEGTVRFHLSQARTRLRAELERRHDRA